MRQFTVSGNPFEMGVQTARAFYPYLVRVRGIYEERIKLPGVRRQVLKLEEQVRREYPDIHAEILGRAEGSEMTPEAAFLMFFPEVFKRVDGCTTLMLFREDGRFLFSHNEDDKGYDNENTALVTYDYGDRKVVGYTMAEKLTGYAFGWNSDGLIYSSNFVYEPRFDLDNISRYVMVRDVMNAKTLEEAVWRLGRMRVASAFSLNIYDRKQNRAVNVEKDIVAVYVTDVADRYARANHFIARRDPLTPAPYASSAFRQEKMNELLPGVSARTASIGDLKRILSYAEEEYDRCVFKDPHVFPYQEKDVTVANFSYDGANDRILIRDAWDGSELRFEGAEIFR